MEIKIFWSSLAENQLKDIYEYYSGIAGKRVAKKITNKIADIVNILKTNPRTGQKEELLAEYKEDFRYLVESNYKIIYWIITSLQFLRCLIAGKILIK